MSRFVRTGIRAIFFDAVGTLIFPEPSAPVVYVETARRHGVSLEIATVRARLGNAFAREEEADRANNWITSDAREQSRWQSIVAESLPEVADQQDCFHELFDYFARPAAWRVNEAASKCFATLRHRGVTIGLASNFDSRLSTVIEGHAVLASTRTHLVISALVGARKPSAVFFAEVVRNVGCAASEILFVGDDVANDFHGALESGLEAVLFDPAGKHTNIEQRIASLMELV